MPVAAAMLVGCVGAFKCPRVATEQAAQSVSTDSRQGHSRVPAVSREQTTTVVPELASEVFRDQKRTCRTAARSTKGQRAFVRDSNTCKRHSTDASHKHPPTARGIDASSIAPPLDAIAATLPRGIGEEKARGRGRLWRGRAVDAEDEEEEGASAASYAVDASPPLTRRWPRRTRRRRTTSPASLDRGTRTTQTRTRPEHRSAAAR